MDNISQFRKGASDSHHHVRNNRLIRYGCEYPNGSYISEQSGALPHLFKDHLQITTTVHELHLSGQIDRSHIPDLYDLYDLVHVAAREPYSLPDL